MNCSSYQLLLFITDRCPQSGMIRLIYNSYIYQYSLSKNAILEKRNLDWFFTLLALYFSTFIVKFIITEFTHYICFSSYLSDSCTTDFSFWFHGENTCSFFLSDVICEVLEKRVKGLWSQPHEILGSSSSLTQSSWEITQNRIKASFFLFSPKQT